MRWFAMLAGVLVLLPNAEGRTQEDAEDLEFFETRIRPILVERCYECHSAGGKRKGGLRLDSRDGTLKGGQRGPAILPGKPEGSLLIRAVRHQDDDLKMPPRQRLSPTEIAALEQWVRRGAVGLRGSRGDGEGADPRPMSLAEAETFWSFQPVKAPRIPEGLDANGAASPVDLFILDRLRERGLSLARPASKATLLRRVSLDLTGLPPTPEEMEAFLADERAVAFEKVVDRLLASLRYGERWGRHWLDVARYADTRAEVILHSREYPHAFRYRDWVIRAFNEDMPYDQFLVHQIAADRIGSDRAALGFLTLGKSTPEPFDIVYEFVDDAIDVVTRGALGLSVSCARCHDHKYDPVPTEDYYSLYGIFATAREVESLLIREDSEPYVAYHRELRRLEDELAAFRNARRAELEHAYRSPEAIAQYLLAARLQTKVHDLNPRMVQRWRTFLADPKKSAPIRQAWQAFRAQALILSWCRINPIVAEPLRVHAPSAGALLKAIQGPRSPVRFSDADVKDFLEGDQRRELERLDKKVADWKDRGIAEIPRVHAVEDAAVPVAPRVFLRGKPTNPGPEVPRRFLAALSGVNRRPFAEGSGRLELARAIASRENPLTARVLVNRVWMHHFGEGLVRTPSDFGARGDRPSHPELLDYLAHRFMEENWSIKKLHRLLLLSNTYAQWSGDNPRAREIDPENRLLWRMTPRLLDVEALRDSLLFVSGSLDMTMGGRSLDLGNPANRRRTVYGFIDRLYLSGVLRSFDFADPETHAPRRYSTTIPQQALFFLNSPFVLDHARRLSELPEIVAEPDPGRRIRRIYSRITQREPTSTEIGLGLEFLRNALSGPISPWARYVHALLMLNEIAFIE
jgi:hypothetical protein